MITDKGHHVFTPFNGCDIYLVTNDEVVAEIGAITWDKQNYIKGELYFTTFKSDVDWGESSIVIAYHNEHGEITKCTMSNSLIIFNPEAELIGDIHSFEASEIACSKSKLS